MLLCWEAGGVLSSGAEALWCSRRRVWKCRGGEEEGVWCGCGGVEEGEGVGGWWVVECVGVASGGSQREAAGFGRRLAAHGSDADRAGQGRSEASKPASERASSRSGRCAKEKAASRGERRTPANNRPNVKRRRWRRGKREAR
jgi:hypothetical protein